MTKKIFLIIFVSFILKADAELLFAQCEIYRIGYEMHQKTDFSKKEIRLMVELLEKAKDDGVEISILEKRIWEGVAKKVDFDTLYKVIKSKIEPIKTAGELISEYERLGIKVDNKTYCLESLSVLMEKELTKVDFRAIANLILLRKLKMEDAIALSKVLVSRGSKKEVKDKIIYDLLDNKDVEDIKKEVEKKFPAQK